MGMPEDQERVSLSWGCSRAVLKFGGEASRILIKVLPLPLAQPSFSRLEILRHAHRVSDIL